MNKLLLKSFEVAALSASLLGVCSCAGEQEDRVLPVNPNLVEAAYDLDIYTLPGTINRSVKVGRLAAGTQVEAICYAESAALAADSVRLRLMNDQEVFAFVTGIPEDPPMNAVLASYVPVVEQQNNFNPQVKPGPNLPACTEEELGRTSIGPRVADTTVLV